MLSGEEWTRLTFLHKEIDHVTFDQELNDQQKKLIQDYLNRHAQLLEDKK